MNDCTFEDTFAASGIDAISSINRDKKMYALVLASSADSSLVSVELVAKAVVKPLRPRRIRSTIDLKPIQS